LLSEHGGLPTKHTKRHESRRAGIRLRRGQIPENCVCGAFYAANVSLRAKAVAKRLSS
jgi:hypothetical protein